MEESQLFIFVLLILVLIYLIINRFRLSRLLPWYVQLPIVETGVTATVDYIDGETPLVGATASLYDASGAKVGDDVNSGDAGDIKFLGPAGDGYVIIIIKDGGEVGRSGNFTIIEGRVINIGVIGTNRARVCKTEMGVA